MAKPIEKFIEKVCVQTAVYWGTPVNDGFGQKTFAAPVEIACRWDGIMELKQDGKGKEFLCFADVLVTQDLDRGGFLWLGVLADLTAAQKANPLLVDNSGEIKGFEKTSMIFKTDEFVRSAYLGKG